MDTLIMSSTDELINKIDFRLKTLSILIDSDMPNSEHFRELYKKYTELRNEVETLRNQ